MSNIKERTSWLTSPTDTLKPVVKLKINGVDTELEIEHWNSHQSFQILGNFITKKAYAKQTNKTYLLLLGTSRLSIVGKPKDENESLAVEDACHFKDYHTTWESVGIPAVIGESNINVPKEIYVLDGNYPVCSEVVGDYPVYVVEEYQLVQSVPTDDKYKLLYQLGQQLKQAHELGFCHQDVGLRKVIKVGSNYSFSPAHVGWLSINRKIPIQFMQKIEQQANNYKAIYHLTNRSYNSFYQSLAQDSHIESYEAFIQLKIKADRRAFGCFVVEQLTGKEPEGQAYCMKAIDFSKLPQSIVDAVTGLVKADIHQVESLDKVLSALENQLS